MTLPIYCLDCGTPSRSGTRCDPCRRRRAALRTSTTERGYDNAWRRLRASILERDGYRCRYCGADATTVDHVVSIRVAPNLRLEPSNLVACCVRCNSTKANKGRRRT
jgi:5-methylcytosine-specific restriction endonuclease McrA